MQESAEGSAADMLVATAQLSAGMDVDANLRQIRALTEKAAHTGARVVAFPEAAMYDWTASAADTTAIATEHGQYFTDEVCRIAGDSEITVIVGGFVKGDSDKPFNRLIVADPHGDMVGTYDKLHLYDAFSFRESDKVQPGPLKEDFSELCILDVGGFKLGLLNCYDLRFPEMGRALAHAGADALVVSSAWVAGPHKEMHWEILLRARAIENTCYVLASSQPPPGSVGLSMIIDPFGLVAATCIETEGVTTSRISRSRLDEVREIVPSSKQGRYAITQP